MAKRIAIRDNEGWITEFEGRKTIRYTELPTKVSSFNHVIQIRGCNGSGKSSIPMSLLTDDPSYVYVTIEPNERKPSATYLPGFNILFVGTYLPGTNCGGCDSVEGPQAVYKILRALWNYEPDIIFEGVIIGDNKIQTYNALVEMRAQAPGRNISFILMDTPLTECLRRIQIRNAGKTFKPELVDKKFRAQQRYWAFLTAQTDVTCHALSTEGTKDEVYQRFLGLYDFGEKMSPEMVATLKSMAEPVQPTPLSERECVDPNFDYPY